ncbi:hypothetical protein AB0M20_17290 [Actinoplanes sp. NPDC051633]|uniref:hypothetical protein n=1 Tax=Actinoplanes sp. NPDC051633 TaxID=3155670 RepID=UPI00343190BE
MMQKLLALLVLGVTAAAGLVASGPNRVVAATSGPALDVLFVGNSLIGTRARTGEDVPDVVRRLARETGRTIHVTKVIKYGSTLRKSWDTGPARRALDGSVRYDVIVLQEFSTLVAKDPAQAEATLLGIYAPALTRALKPRGRVVLFKNWAIVKPALFASRPAYLAAINTGYTRLADGLASLALPVVIAPISDEFEAVRSRGGAGPLIVPDGKHPSAQAIYLEAATLYALIFRASPRELPNLFVPTAKATRLRAVAATALGY